MELGVLNKIDRELNNSGNKNPDHNNNDETYEEKQNNGFSKNHHLLEMGTELRPPIASVGTLSMFAHVLYCSLLEACNFVHMHMRTYFIKLL